MVRAQSSEAQQLQFTDGVIEISVSTQWLTPQRIKNIIELFQLQYTKEEVDVFAEQD